MSLASQADENIQEVAKDVIEKGICPLIVTAEESPVSIIHNGSIFFHVNSRICET